MNTIKVKNLAPIPLSKKRFTVGVLLGLCYAFVVYGLMYMIREACRIFSIAMTGSLWVFNPEEVFFYNWNFAFLALIIGQSITIGFCLDRPRKAFQEKSKNRRLSIIVDNRMLSWNTVAWYAKVGYLISIIVMMMPISGDDTISFYKDYGYLFILMNLILFYHSFMTIRRIYKKKSRVWMGITFISFLVISFVMANIHIIDYNKVNKQILDKDLVYKYNIDLPFSKNQEAIHTIRNDRSLDWKIYIINNENNDDAQYFFYDNEKPMKSIDSEILNGYLEEKRNSLPEEKRSRIIPVIYIDKNVKMKYVDELHIALLENMLFKVYYEYHDMESINYVLKGDVYKNLFTKIPYRELVDDVFNMSLPLIEVSQMKSDYNHHINIRINDNGQIYINENSIVKEELVNILFDLMYKKDSNLCILNMDKNAIFDDYFHYIMSFEIAKEKIKTRWAKEQYDMPYNQLSLEQRRSISKCISIQRLDFVE